MGGAGRVAEYTASRQTNLLVVIWRKPAYRACCASLFLIGLAVSAGMPFVTLYLVRDLGASLSVVGLFFLTALVGPLVSGLTGRLSDRLPTRLPLIRLSALWLATGWLLLCAARHVWVAFAISIVFFCLVGTVNAQIFAILHDVMGREEERRSNAVVSTIRTAYSLGWMGGPLIGSSLAAAGSYRLAFIATAVLYILSFLPLQLLNRSIPLSLNHPPPRPTRGSGSVWVIVVFVALCTLAMSGDTVRLAYLPILAVDILHLTPVALGIAISLQPLIEVLIMPMTGLLAERFGLTKVISAGLVLGGMGYVTLAASTTLWQIYLAEIFIACLVAVFLSLGIVYVQQLAPTSPGFTTSIFFGGLSFSSTLGAIIGSVGTRLFGVPHVFLLPAMVCFVALVALVATDALRLGRH